MRLVPLLLSLTHYGVNPVRIYGAATPESERDHQFILHTACLDYGESNTHSFPARPLARSVFAVAGLGELPADLVLRLRPLFL